MRTAGIWLTVVMAAGVAGATPVTTTTASTIDADFPMSGSAICDVTTGLWTYRWGVKSYGNGAKVVSARDPESGEVLPVSTTDLIPGRQVAANGTAAGSATAVAIDLVLQVAGEASPRTLQRRMPLDGACLATDLGPCVEWPEARFIHTFDAAGGRATIRVDGPPSCTTTGVQFSRWFWPDEQARQEATVFFPLTRTKPRAVFHLDRLPCDNQLALTVSASVAGSPDSPSSGPYALDKQELGRCMATSVVNDQTCIGIRLNLANGPEAKLTASLLLRRQRADGSFDEWSQALPPGGSWSVFVPAIGDPPAAVVQVSLNGYWISEGVWVKPSACTERGIPPVRGPSPGATPTSSPRPLPPIRN